MALSLTCKLLAFGLWVIILLCPPQPRVGGAILETLCPSFCPSFCLSHILVTWTPHSLLDGIDSNFQHLLPYMPSCAGGKKIWICFFLSRVVALCYFMLYTIYGNFVTWTLHSLLDGVDSNFQQWLPLMPCCAGGKKIWICFFHSRVTALCYFLLYTLWELLIHYCMELIETPHSAMTTIYA